MTEEIESVVMEPISTLPEDEDEWYRTTEHVVTKKRKHEEDDNDDVRLKFKPNLAIIVMVYLDDSVLTTVKVIAQSSVSPVIWDYLCQLRPDKAGELVSTNVEKSDNPILQEVYEWFHDTFLASPDKIHKESRKDHHHEADPSRGYFLGAQANFNASEYTLVGMRSLWGFQ